MRVSRYSYYGDFFIYPATAAALTATALWLHPSLEAVGAWTIAFLIGLGSGRSPSICCTGSCFHHVPVIKEMHDAHHEDEKALIGTPTWLSFVIIAGGVLIPLYFVLDFVKMSGLSAGIIVGYLWYITVHHMVHHWEVRPDSYGYRLKRRHALHHYFDDHGNFGVSSGFWDKVFGTDINVKTARAKRQEG